MKKLPKPALLLGLVTCSITLTAQKKDKEAMIAAIDARMEEYSGIAHQIWEFAEVGYQEVQSSALLQQQLEKEGFVIEKGVAKIPTAFTATFGAGEPVIGILGEFDALPGLSQKAEPSKDPVIVGGAGHACGHHLFGTASLAAAVALKDWLQDNNRRGTVRFYGTPAEEGGSGKVYMVREGLFEDVDVVIQWHPGDRNATAVATSLANKTGKFRFYGVASHAAVAPERGRSALDGVEAMNMMVNMMREHTTEGSRIHYIITRGGTAPNVVPDFAEVYYYVRHGDNEEVRAMFDRIVLAAQGAALGTETRMDYEVVSGVYSLLPNEPLAKVMDENLQMVGGVNYNAEELEFAEKISSSFGSKTLLSMAKTVGPIFYGEGKGSTDVGDVSWIVPTVGLRTATWVPGTAPHSWQAVAAGGMSIGWKGMMVAAKSMALMGMDLFLDAKLIDAAKKDFEDRRGADFQYAPLLGDRAPALNYRN
ncbi:MAG: amidohydrolase [Bacteroidota bacterium]